MAAQCGFDYPEAKAAKALPFLEHVSTLPPDATATYPGREELLGG